MSQIISSTENYGKGRRHILQSLCLFDVDTPIKIHLKGVFAKNKRGYRLNAIKKRF